MWPGGLGSHVPGEEGGQGRRKKSEILEWDFVCARACEDVSVYYSGLLQSKQDAVSHKTTNMLILSPLLASYPLTSPPPILPPLLKSAL